MDPIHPKEPPRLHLAHLPTPLAPLKRLAAELQTPQVLLKRDDLTGIELTGNKVRKLEYLLADAIGTGCDTIVTNGGYQSNHCRATAAACARLGLRLRLILRAPSADRPPAIANLLLDHLFGAEINFHSPDEYASRRDALIENAMAQERSLGRRPYFFPVGGSVPLGSWGYIRCVHELINQLPGDRPAAVFVAVSSSGTLAGMLLGRALLRADRMRIIGVPVSDKLELFRPDVCAIIQQTIERFKLPVDPGQCGIDLLDGFIGGGYAIPTPESQEAIRLLARLEGIALDPTYTAKAMAGFLHAVRNGRLLADEIPVFVHTGGIYGLLARPDLFPEFQ